MNIYAISDKYRIPLCKLRKMKSAGILNCAPENPIVDKARQALRRGKHLSVEQILALVADPELLFELGDYADMAVGQMEALGDMKAGAAPLEITVEVDDAAHGRQNAIATILPWLKSIIPPHGSVGHHYIGTRLLMACGPNTLPYYLKRLPRALLNCRNHRDFSNWWHLETPKTGNVSHYHRPPPTYDL